MPVRQLKEKQFYNMHDASPVMGHESPREPGVFLIPGGAVDSTPPDFDKSTHTCVWDTESSDWIVDEIVVEEDTYMQKFEFDPMDRVRNVRNQLLAMSDVYMTEDFPISADKKAEWKTFRNKLRDLPVDQPNPGGNNFINDGKLNITWPDRPDGVSYTDANGEPEML